MGLFKTSGTFTYYVNIQCGNDLLAGDRNNPYGSLSKAAMENRYVLINGYSNENVVASGFIIGDTPDSGMLSFGNGIDQNSAILNLKVGTWNNIYFLAKNCIIETFGVFLGRTPTVIPYGFSNKDCTNNFIHNLKLQQLDRLVNNTIKNFFNYNNTNTSIRNSIFISELNLYNFTSHSNTTYYPIFQNCLFRKATVWKWNTATISINWTNNPVGGAAYTNETLMTIVYNSLLFYANSLTAGTDKTYFLAILATQDTMFKECLVWDDTDTVNNPIFSRYIDGVPVDYTLALKSNNPALYMSTTGSYVGCYAANVNDDGHGNHITFGSVKHVDVSTGLDTATAPDLLIQDTSNPAKFSASQSSLQLWNRIRTSVVEYPRGKSFAGMQSQLDSGIASRLFFGKRQEIRTTGDISQKTTAFESIEVIPYDSLPTPNSGAENTIDNMSTLLPRFSAPFNGECLIFYKAGVPLKFNDYNGLKTLFTGAGLVTTNGTSTITGNGSTTFLADFVKDDNIRINGVDYKVLSVASNSNMTATTTVPAQTNVSYQVGVTVDKSYDIYGNWAVTNADIESYSLLQKATKAGLKTSIPLIKWCKFELNLHYDEE